MSRPKSERHDVLTTINASIREPVTSDELAAWIQGVNLSDERASHALSVFFIEVSLEMQIRFLSHYALDEQAAYALARRTLGDHTPIALQRRFAW